MTTVMPELPTTLLHNIGDVLDLGVLVLDRERRIVGWNRWLEISSGMAGSAVLGQRITEVFPEFRDTSGDRAITRVLKGATVVLAHRFHEHFIRLPAPPGESAFAVMQQSTRVVPHIDDAGRVIGAIALIEDVTERVARDRELRQALHDAQDANRTKAEFLASMSHELRTPLAGISGYADLLAQEIVGPVSEAQKQHLRRIKSISEHVLMLVDEILSFTRLQAGREPIEFDEVVADDIVRAAAAIVEPAIRAKAIEFVVRLASEPVVMVTDQLKLRQILVNLLGNAAKFVDEGSITLTLDADPGQATVSFEITDTGPGISPENQPRVFEPFTQIDSKLTRRIKGTGLGLPLSRQLAKLLGGDIELRSEVGVGSTFAVTLPRRPRELSMVQLQIER